MDIKEGSTGNIVDSNICTAQLDANSGCYNSRGDDNTFWCVLHVKNAYFEVTIYGGFGFCKRVFIVVRILFGFKFLVFAVWA